MFCTQCSKKTHTHTHTRKTDDQRRKMLGVIQQAAENARARSSPGNHKGREKKGNKKRKKRKGQKSESAHPKIGEMGPKDHHRHGL